MTPVRVGHRFGDSWLKLFKAFLRTKEGDAGTVIDYRNWQIALGRRFRSVKLWFVMRSYGVDGFRKHLMEVGVETAGTSPSISSLILRQGIGHCERLASMVEASPTFELVATPCLALLVFRLKHPTESSTDPVLNLLNQRLSSRLNARYDVFLTQTVLHSLEREVFCIRFAMGGVNTTMEDVNSTWRIIESEGGEVVKAWDRERADSKF